MCAPYQERSKPIFLLWFIRRSSVHLTATLSKILTDFNNFCTAETRKKCPKQGMQRVHHSIVKDVEELRERLISARCELDQSVVNHAVDKWRCRLLACCLLYTSDAADE